MIEYIISLTIILLVVGVYKYAIKPKRIYNRYAGSITELGYRVHKANFNPVGHFFVKMLEEDSKKGDPLLFWKTTAAKTDIVVGNIFNYVSLGLSHPDFIKDYYSN